MSDSVLVGGREGAAIGCHALPDPDFGAPAVELILYLPAQDRSGSIRLDPNAAIRLAQALVAAAEGVGHAHNAWILRERGIERTLPFPEAEENP